MGYTTAAKKKGMSYAFPGLWAPEDMASKLDDGYDNTLPVEVIKTTKGVNSDGPWIKRYVRATIGNRLTIFSYAQVVLDGNFYSVMCPKMNRDVVFHNAEDSMDPLV